MGRYARIVVTSILLVFFSGLAPAEELSPNYQTSLSISRQHADNPAGWVPDPGSGDKQIFTITGNPATENAAFGLKYDSSYGDGKDYLVVRTVTKASYYSGNYVNQSGYKIFGNATTAAAWVTTGNDATKFLQQNGGTSANIVKLLERGLGMNNDGSHTAVVEYAVIADNDHILRPTKDPYISEYPTTSSSYGTSASFAAKDSAKISDAAYYNFVGGGGVSKGYYQYWKEQTYDSALTSSSAFPWSQIGYTFFWGNGESLSNIQGMSEFILPGGTSVQIYAIYAPQSYIYTLNKGGAFSSDTDAQYGNGFASFKINGSCDTVWAGHRFQKNVSSDTTDGNRNQIRIESNGSVSGGQGLLVWSLNYDVINNGTISGATGDKFGIAGTSNIAVLFKGDTSTSYGTPVTAVGAKNRLTNSGTISSSGTAVKAEAGNTEITNNAGGVISGSSYAIQTGAGNDTVTVKGGEIAGKVNLGTGTDAFNVTNADENAKLSFTLNRSTASSAQIVVKDAGTGAVSIADHTKISVSVTGSNNLQNNDRFLIVDTGTLTVDPTKLTIVNDATLPMITFLAEKSGNQLSLVASRSNNYYRQHSGNASLGELLDSLANTSSGDMAVVLGALDSSGSGGNARQMEPNVGGGTVQGGYATVGQFNSAITSRVGQVWAALAGSTGISTGDEAAASEGVWAKGSAARLDQGARGTSSGYDAQVRGLSAGYDRLVFPHLVLGFSGGHATTAIGTSDRNTHTDVDSFQSGIYGSYARNDYHVDGILSFAYNDYTASRHIAFGSIDRIARSNYAGQQYTAYFEGGNTFKMGRIFLTPLASIQYTRLRLSGYTEGGADSLNLSVDGQSYHFFQTGLGGKGAYPMVHAGVQITPELHAKWLYDFAGDRQQATSTFTGSGASFTTQGFEPAKSSYNVGARLAVLTKENLTVSLSYDFETKADFQSHRGSLEFRYAF